MFLFPVLQLVPSGPTEGHGADVEPLDIRQCRLRYPVRSCHVLAFGPNALLYLFASFWFSVGGLHPLGGRADPGAFHPDPDQETLDYYGALNLVALNIGYHNEHHDFPDVPWRRLPELKRMAPEFYNGLKTHKSWSGLVDRFHLRPALYTVHPSRSQRRALSCFHRGESRRSLGAEIWWYGRPYCSKF